MKRPVKDLTHDAEISISVHIIASVRFFFTLRDQATATSCTLVLLQLELLNDFPVRALNSSD